MAKESKNTEKTQDNVQDSNNLDNFNAAATMALEAKIVEYEKKIDDLEREVASLKIDKDEAAESYSKVLADLKANHDEEIVRLAEQYEAKVEEQKQLIVQQNEEAKSTPSVITIDDVQGYAEHYSRSDPKSGKHPMSPTDWLLTFSPTFLPTI